MTISCLILKIIISVGAYKVGGSMRLIITIFKSRFHGKIVEIILSVSLRLTKY